MRTSPLVVLVVAALVLCGAAPAPAAPVASRPQTQGRVTLDRITVAQDTVTMFFTATDIGAGSRDFVGTQTVADVVGCDLEPDSVRNTVLAYGTTRKGDFTFSMSGKASEMGSDWVLGAGTGEDFKDPFSFRIVNSDPRMQFTCGVPNTTDLDLVYGGGGSGGGSGGSGGGSGTPEVEVTSWSTKVGSPTIGSTIGVTETTAEPGASITYAWLVDGVEVAQGRRLSVIADYRGSRPVARISVTKEGELGRTLDLAFGPVVDRTVAVSSWSEWNGVRTVGGVARVTPTVAESGASVSYAWILAGRVVDTDRAVRLRPAWRGERLLLRVAVTKPQRRPVVRTLVRTRVR